MIEVIPGPGLSHLGAVVEEEFEDVPGFVAGILEHDYKGQALETRSYRSGDFYRNIHRAPQTVIFGDTKYRDVISDVGYGDIIESIGWGPGNPPRFPAKKAVEAANSDIEKILSDAAERVIDRIENG
jgi:hypothetical protein